MVFDAVFFYIFGILTFRIAGCLKETNIENSPVLIGSAAFVSFGTTMLILNTHWFHSYIDGLIKDGGESLSLFVVAFAVLMMGIHYIIIVCISITFARYRSKKNKMAS